MSRVGKQNIIIPSKVQVSFNTGLLKVVGPLGELQRQFLPIIDIKVTDQDINLSPIKEDDKEAKALWGTYASHVLNMISGVSKGYEKKLVIEGIGYKFTVNDKEVVLDIGYSHEVKMPIPEGIKCQLEKNVLTISGIDKELVGSFAASIRQQKKTEPYKGKGIRYIDEIPKRKQGKKVVG